MIEQILQTRKDKQQFKQWLEALRSGEYKQTAICLQDNNGYCCLGVACEVLIDEDKKSRYLGSGYLFGGMPISQPNAPQWLKEINGNFFKRTDTNLTSFNDYDGYSFDEIADILEIEYIHGVE